jgi:outer membrane immunogenic protein
MLLKMTLTAALAACVAAPAFAQSASGGVNWNGPYVGINLGYTGGAFNYPSAGTVDAAGTNPVTGQLKTSSSGILGGGQIGYNIETPNGMVFGLETDLDGTGVNGGTTFDSLDSTGAANAAQVQSKIDYLGTLRGRVGKAMFDGRFLPYVTGGLAYGDVNTSTAVNCVACGFQGAGVTSATSQTTGRTGWTVGAGTEYALTRHLSFKAEYLYADLGRQPLASDAAEISAPGVNIFNATTGAETTANVVRVGLNYRF